MEDPTAQTNTDKKTKLISNDRGGIGYTTHVTQSLFDGCCSCSYSRFVPIPFATSLLKHGDECFEPEACPCLWKGKEYYPGDKVSSPCHQWYVSTVCLCLFSIIESRMELISWNVGVISSFYVHCVIERNEKKVSTALPRHSFCWPEIGVEVEQYKGPPDIIILLSQRRKDLGNKVGSCITVILSVVHQWWKGTLSQWSHSFCPFVIQVEHDDDDDSLIVIRPFPLFSCRQFPKGVANTCEQTVFVMVWQQVHPETLPSL